MKKIVGKEIPELEVEGVSARKEEPAEEAPKREARAKPDRDRSRGKKGA